MSLIAEIERAEGAMRARDAERRDALRLILNALKGSQKELQRPLNEDEELQVLERERKRRRGGGRGLPLRRPARRRPSWRSGSSTLEEFMPSRSPRTRSRRSSTT